MTHQLLGQRHLLELHLVDAGLGGAKHDAGGEEHGALHDGSRGRRAGGCWLDGWKRVALGEMGWKRVGWLTESASGERELPAVVPGLAPLPFVI